MRETDRKKIPNNSQTKRPTAAPPPASALRTARRRDNNLLQENSSRGTHVVKRIGHHAANRTSSLPVKKGKAASPIEAVAAAAAARDHAVKEATTAETVPRLYEDVDIHYVDDLDVNKSDETVTGSHEDDSSCNNDDDSEGGALNGSSDRVKEEQEEEKVEPQGSDSETIEEDPVSITEHTTTDDEKVKKLPFSRVPKRLPKETEIATRLSSRLDKSKSPPLVWSSATSHAKKPLKSINPAGLLVNDTCPEVNSDNMRDYYASSDSSEAVDDKPKQECFDVASNGDDSTVDDHVEDDHDDARKEGERAGLNQQIQEMTARIEKLEGELKDVAALEISLYSVVPEHGSSAHKVHTPARRLSRLYIHASKHWSQKKRAAVAKNTVSGLVLVARACGNDVARLTFWLSNTVVLREMISQAFGSTGHSISPPRLSESNGGGKEINTMCLMQCVEDWQETRTFTADLERIESWLFGRIVESVWWQTLTPNMQAPVEDLIARRSIGKLRGPAIGDQEQGHFSIELWKRAFQDAFQGLCPVRAAGHECGCLPVLAKMVMEQCADRLDVAMFNAILRESAHQIPTDPVSDPVVDSRVLPIPAGDLSFGSGAQLKNAVGNWSQCLADSFGIATSYQTNDNHQGVDDENDGQGGYTKVQCFHLLDELSDLLMLPKDMLMDRSIRKEVCPSISLPLVKRVLCNFSPDEFCPEYVPGEVLELLNAESVVERKLSGDKAGSFPYTAPAVAYTPPSSGHVAEKAAEAGGNHQQLERNVSTVQQKGYTSDEELDDLDCPLISIIDEFAPSLSFSRNGNGSPRQKQRTANGGVNTRYELLREVWSV